MTVIASKYEEMTKRIEESLDSIRPYLQADGGDVKILSFNQNHVLKLEFVGNCGSCPMSTMTFKAGIEEAIKKAVPEIQAIEVVNLSSN
jgi:Fe-S cluster biogenesis protein NfuA